MEFYKIDLLFIQLHYEKRTLSHLHFLLLFLLFPPYKLCRSILFYTSVKQVPPFLTCFTVTFVNEEEKTNNSFSIKKFKLDSLINFPSRCENSTKFRLYTYALLQSKRYVCLFVFVFAFFFCFFHFLSFILHCTILD